MLLQLEFERLSGNAFSIFKDIMNQDIRLTGVRMSPIAGGLFSLGSHHSGPQHIEAVTNGVRWWSVSEVIVLLALGQQFYVEDFAGNKAYVEAVYPGLFGLGNRPYIKTRPDGIISDNLLALPGGPLYQGGLFGSGIVANARRRGLLG